MKLTYDRCSQIRVHDATSSRLELPTPGPEVFCAARHRQGGRSQERPSRTWVSVVRRSSIDVPLTPIGSSDSATSTPVISPRHHSPKVLQSTVHHLLPARTRHNLPPFPGLANRPPNPRQLHHHPLQEPARRPHATPRSTSSATRPRRSRRRR